MKKYLFIATALAALASCSSDEFVGDNTSPTTSNTPGAIQFTSNTPRITRADGLDAAKALGYKFKVYGVKKVGDDYSNVFATGAYSSATDYNAAPDAYWVWWGNNAGTTASNTKGWDYVGTTNTAYGTNDEQNNKDYRVTLTEDQTIKYWDYSASQYEFVAYSATATTGTGDDQTPKITKYTKDGFTVEATAADLAGLYVADKKVITSTDYKKDVQFTFRSAAAKVRLGIYETINGYQVKNVSFRPNTSGDFTESNTKALLSGSFNGTSSNASGIYKVTYADSEPYNAIFTRDNTSTDFRSGYFDFGSFASTDKIGEASNAPTWAGATTSPSNAPYYQSVLPNTDNVDNMILYVDYDLYNDKSGETIHVKGAKAVVPSIYMKWNPNYAYTYLFKISDNTNGTTGTEGTSPEGLFPITFDALTIAAAGTEVGTITTVSTPAITTYQKGSVSSSGITYATASTTEPIYITVNTAGTLAPLSIDAATCNIKLYTVDAGTTEADLILGTKTKTPASGLSILDQATTLQGIAFENGKTATFTPTAGTIYAVEYKYTNDNKDVYQYKIIEVAAANNNSGSGS